MTRSTLRKIPLSEFERDARSILAELDAEHESVEITWGGRTYRLGPGVEDESDPWADYDAEALVSLLQRKLRVLDGVDTKQLLEDIAEQRKQDADRAS